MNQFNSVRRHPVAFLRPPVGIRRASRAWCIVGCLALGLTHPSPVSAQLAAPDTSPSATPATTALPPDGKPPEPKPKRDEIQQRLEQSKTLPELDDPQKAAVVEAYQKALKELDRADECAKLAADFDLRTKNAPVELQHARKELEQPAATLKLELPANSSLAELESDLTQKKAELAGAQERLTRLEAEPKRRAERRLTSIPKESEQAGSQLAEVLKSLQAPPAEGDPEPLRAARRTLLSARKIARENEIAALKSERECYNAEDELLPKQRDLATRNVALKKAEVEAWQTIIQVRRAKDATRKVQQAVREKKQTSPELQGIAAENEELAKRVKTINDSIAVAEQQSNEFKNVLADLQAQLCRFEVSLQHLRGHARDRAPIAAIPRGVAPPASASRPGARRRLDHRASGPRVDQAERGSKKAQRCYGPSQRDHGHARSLGAAPAFARSARL